MGARGDFHLCRRPLPFVRPSFFIRRSALAELIFKFSDKTLHRPRAGFAKRADGPASGNVVGNAYQVISVTASSPSMRQSMQGLAHPKRTLAAWCALAATLMRIELGD